MSPETKANLGPVQNLGITLGSGIVAGFAAAVLSHVSDYTNCGMFSISSAIALSFLLIHLACRYSAIPD
jgi:hypothetical protein